MCHRTKQNKEKDSLEKDSLTTNLLLFLFPPLPRRLQFLKFHGVIPQNLLGVQTGGAVEHQGLCLCVRVGGKKLGIE